MVRTLPFSVFEIGIPVQAFLEFLDTGLAGFGVEVLDGGKEAVHAEEEAEAGGPSRRCREIGAVCID